MGFNFRTVDRDQQFLMPPSIAEWLPEEHLAWFVIDVVGELDLSEFEDRYRVDGRGAAAYDPSMMTGLWLYAYCVGEQSSRQVERRCVEDVPFRVLAANQRPDHSTIARFRQEHSAALSGLFAQVLALCARAGLVRVDVVALDGTKLRANASRNASREVADLEAQLAAWFAEAEDVDAAEEAVAPWSRRAEMGKQDRRRRVVEALRQARSDTTSNERVRRNISDPDSRLMKARQGFVQGYNAQAIATADQVVLAAEVSTAPIDRNELVPMIDAAARMLEDAAVTDEVGVLLADAGYWSHQNATSDVSCELLIATTTSSKQAEGPSEAVRSRITADDEANAVDEAEFDRRAQILERRCKGELSMEATAGEIGVSVGRAYALLRRYRLDGRNGLLSRRHRPNGRRRVDRVRQHMRVKHAMNEVLATERGRRLYSQRKVMIEPVFGQHKAVRGFDHFSCRGRQACDTEWKLINLTHNMLKLWRS
jgi:transposase